MPSPRYCSCVGVEMAYPLLRLKNIEIEVLVRLIELSYQKNIIGQSSVAAKLSAACASPSDAAPNSIECNRVN